ncbi:hypothetical protein [Paenibacillus sp. URB8-2]|uniref:hypothetical protein n=1 Tax=Paenibacillus sp. URB8-2 TaxID=2741301 RepID=UPI0015BEB5C3|nr:hypothetical protein [Paenibacillus sp. URB8-2]BCG60196.1 hypothetical protein PUR_36210 [Paenibacillus sp. URB8-2]
MKKDNAGRMVNGEELMEFKGLTFNERIKWVREELNKIYIGEYSVKQVAISSGAISHVGLYNLEKSSDSSPRKNTLKELASFYQVPLAIFSANDPDPFFLGKQFGDENIEQKTADIRDPLYKLRHTFVLYSPEGKPVLEEAIEVDVRHIDAEEWLQRLQYEKDILQKRLLKQKKIDEAYDYLNGRKHHD